MRQQLTSTQKKLLEDLPNYSMSLGINKSLYNQNQIKISHMPIALYPYLITNTIYQFLLQIHYIWQNLFIKVSSDKSFIISISQQFCNNDIFMKKLYNIYLKNTNPKTGIACTRIDYMGDADPKLVQYNLMSVGLVGISDLVQNLQNILNKYNSPLGKYTYPTNKNLQIFSKSLITALQLQNFKTGLILMIVHDKQFNYGDQNIVKLTLLKHGRQVTSVTMSYLINHMKYNQITKDAYLDNQHIDVFYFRTGYKLQHFPNQQYWNIRQQIQLSNAIKLPSIEMILINSKRIQSEFAKQSVLLKYLNKQQANKLLSISGQIYDFDQKTDEEIKSLIQKCSKQDYVLKPNREGGGNNFFGKFAHQKLQQLYKQKQNLKNYILMKKIHSTIYDNYFVAENSNQYVEQTTAQYSTFGCFVYRGNQIILNQVGGTLVRLKKKQYQEGGIAINKGAITGVCVVNYQ